MNRPVASAFDLNQPKRFELKTDQGRIIAAKDVQIGVGRYNDSMGIGHCAIHVLDPQLGEGERRVYVITREALQDIIGGAMRLVNEISATGAGIIPGR